MGKPRASGDELRARMAELLDVLNTQDDLPCVLVAASYLDQQVASLLERYFIPARTSEELLSPAGVLGTYNARVSTAYALGLLSKPLFRNLNTIGEIRNRVAHHHLLLDFSDSSVEELVGKLTYPSVTKSVFVDAATGFVDAGADPWGHITTARGKFTAIAVNLVVDLVVEGEMVQQKPRAPRA